MDGSPLVVLLREARQMTLKRKTFPWTKFPPEVLREALITFEKYLPENRRTGKSSHRSLVMANGDSWEHNTDDEHFADYRRPECVSAGWRMLGGYDGDLLTNFYTAGNPQTVVSVDLPERYQVEQVFEVLESRIAEGKIGPPVVRPVIFIGHGGSPLWRELNDQLRDKHGLQCIAFESGPRAGKLAKDVVTQMAAEASFALLVHTAEDEQADGSMRARENVVHETGLFQGHLGWNRAIVLREEGCDDFSNIGGLQEIRFHTGNIKETFGEVVATIHREFPDR
jgi:predicted nucleotide-binding protein